MMKKLVGAICAMTLVAGLSLTAVAAPSVHGGSIGAVNNNGGTLIIDKISFSEVTGSEECDHVEEGEHCPGVIEVLPGITQEYRDEVAALDFEALIAGTPYAELEWVDILEIEVITKGCVPDSVFPVTITFDVGEWVEGTPLVAHYSSVKQEWELIVATVVNGKVQATFDSFSPIVFFVEKTAETPDDPSSPVTGDPLSIGLVAIAVGPAGLVATRKKRA